MGITALQYLFSNQLQNVIYVLNVSQVIVFTCSNPLSQDQ